MLFRLDAIAYLKENGTKMYKFKKTHEIIFKNYQHPMNVETIRKPIYLRENLNFEKIIIIIFQF